MKLAVIVWSLLILFIGFCIMPEIMIFLFICFIGLFLWQLK